MCTDHCLPLNCISQPHPLRSCTPTTKSPECTSHVPNLSHFQAFAWGCSLSCSVPKSSWGRLITYCNSGFSLKVTSLGRPSVTTNLIQRNFPAAHQLFSSEVKQLVRHYTRLHHYLVKAHLSTTSPQTQNSAETKERSNIFQGLNE